MNLQYVHFWPSECFGFINCIIVWCHCSTDKANMPIMSMIFCWQVELETDSSGRMIWEVNKLPWNIVISSGNLAVVTLNRQRRTITSILAIILNMNGQRENSVVHEARSSNQQGIRAPQIGTAHARNCCYVKFQVINKRKQIRSICRSDFMHFNAPFCNYLIQQPVKVIQLSCQYDR